MGKRLSGKRHLLKGRIPSIRGDVVAKRPSTNGGVLGKRLSNNHNSRVEGAVHTTHIVRQYNIMRERGNAEKWPETHTRHMSTTAAKEGAEKGEMRHEGKHLNNTRPQYVMSGKKTYTTHGVNIAAKKRAEKRGWGGKPHSHST